MALHGDVLAWLSVLLPCEYLEEEQGLFPQ